MPSLFHDLVRRRGVALLQKAFGEAIATGGREAVTYITPAGRRRQLDVILGSVRATNEEVVDGEASEAYETKHRRRSIFITRGTAKGQLPRPPQLEARFEIEGEIWFVLEIESEGPNLAELVLVHEAEVNRDRPGTR